MSGWYLEDQATAYSEAIAKQLHDDHAVVPALWELEFSNVLRTACRRHRMDAHSAQAVAAQIALLPINVDRQGVPPAELLGLALRFGLTSYDASYLALALRLQLPIATVDTTLRAAALSSGVGLVLE